MGYGWIGLLLLIANLTMHGTTVFANSSSGVDLTEMSIEEVLQLEVTSAAKKPQKLGNAAAAIFALTADDIRRSGATSIPEALRMVPGLQVARIDSNKWAITSRGFNGRFANKLLVLIDGRSVYTPSFSGVYWEVQDTLLADLDRIEVIRGPGAALWGANAVNGIINIITKHARDTQGGLLTAGAGTEERGTGSLRYGTALSDTAFLRIYAKYFNRDGSVDTEGRSTPDAWETIRSGVRLDWQATNDDDLTIQGDVYYGEAKQTLSLPSFTPPYRERRTTGIDWVGGNLLGRWQHRFTDLGNLTLQAYYDRTSRDESGVMQETRDTFDLDMQHQFLWGNRQDIIWGLGYRFTDDTFNRSNLIRVQPRSRSLHLFSAFVQDDITLIEDRLKLIVGSKFEHNDHTGFEVQPTVRLLWTPHKRHTVWAALSRAVRTPSRGDDDALTDQLILPPKTLQNPGPLPVLVRFLGNRDFVSEKLLAYELGYRMRPIDRLSLDIAAFYNTYDDLRTVEPGLPFTDLTSTPPVIISPLTLDNKLQGETYGVELALEWQLLDRWRINLAYTFLQLDFDLDGDSQSTTSGNDAGFSPNHQVSLRSSIELPGKLTLDTWLRYVDTLSALDIDRYVTLDIRLAWQPLESIELALVGQNLVESHHSEFRQEIFPFQTEIERGVYGAISWRF
ncbi:MAG: TonB-denpendent receptor [Candidatus Entotheonella factor]|uniref:TonB-denpendent receptor n=1 Tax=Entotheonella factor TaxID=1429438 RepID=W4LY38_ENTF1|nr:MAG: TonB-denpendent receptor [Candidatus Entotheonella factor]